MMARWHALAPRERQLIGVAGAVLTAAVLWIAVWEPLDRHRDDLRARVAAQQALADWLGTLEAGAPLEAASERSLGGRSALAVIDQSARAAGLAGALVRIEPGAAGEVRVVLQRAEFPALMRWLVDLVEERPFRVVDLRADRAEAGRVDATLVLERSD
ncbi:type II secretion system protein M [Halomonas denitrificans]|nr:type II secretion system protein M [Halomonas denitrificans]